ncbi:MAG TPA: right-handed parallel beta-helix repeat-containing protein, partial [Opitutaceae bacterium]|nr:right-handed parallel beta-helix repeat-containing protein [Opitutaceae bacterium]
LFRAGEVWNGGQLHPLGSGSATAPIVIDRYGDGPLPALAGEGRVRCVLLLENQSGWVIRHLELTNHSAGSPGHLRAVEIRAHDAGWVRHIRLDGLYVHDVNAVSDYHNDGDTSAKSFGGIATIIDGTRTPTAWDDLVVTNCRIEDVGPIGLVMLSTWMSGHRENDPRTWFPSRGVVIRGNRFERIARNGLIVRGCRAPLIERNFFRGCGQLGSGNAMFVFHCDDALVQFNEACFTKYNLGDSDASGFDSDYNCRRSVFQYNYSHDNGYGFMLLCCLGSPRAHAFNDGTIVRYNISQNDGGNVIRVSGRVTNALIYNNTILTSPDMTNPRAGDPPRILFFKSWSGWSDGVSFFNNIVDNGSARAVYEFGASTHNRTAHNVYFGYHPASEPAEPGKVTGDPRFAAPGRAGLGVDAAAAAYRIGAGSAAIGAGVVLPGQPGRDFAGQPVRRSAGRTDAGALAAETSP